MEAIFGRPSESIIVPVNSVITKLPESLTVNFHHLPFDDCKHIVPDLKKLSFSVIC